jgi:hypothetical protein
MSENSSLLGLVGGIARPILRKVLTARYGDRTEIKVARNNMLRRCYHIGHQPLALAPSPPAHHRGAFWEKPRPSGWPR